MSLPAICRCVRLSRRCKKNVGERNLKTIKNVLKRGEKKRLIRDKNVQHLSVTHAFAGQQCQRLTGPKLKGSPYSIAERRVPQLIPVLGSQPAGDVSHKPGGRLPLLSSMPAVTLYQCRCLLNRGTMGVNSLSKTFTRQRRGCDLNPGPPAPEFSTLSTRLPSHPWSKRESGNRRADGHDRLQYLPC